MTEFFNGRARRQSSASRSFCARCGNAVEDTRVSPGRGSWADKKRGLSLEIDGREGREVRRRHSSSNFGSDKQKTSPSHCYIVPINNGVGSASAAGTSTSTYKESFRSPSRSQSASRQIRSTPSSPVSTLSPWSTTSSSSFSPVPSPSTQQASSSDMLAPLSRPPSRFSGRDGSLDRTNTTYNDHFTWLS